MEFVVTQKIWENLSKDENQDEINLKPKKICKTSPDINPIKYWIKNHNYSRLSNFFSAMRYIFKGYKLYDLFYEIFYFIENDKIDFDLILAGFENSYPVFVKNAYIN